MSLPASAPLLIVDPRPSRRLRRAWLTLQGAALAAAALLAPPWLVPVLALLAMGAVIEARQLHGRGRIEARPDGSWRIARPGGRLPAQLAAGTFCSRWLVVLHLRTDAGIVRRTLLPDSLDSETWRRLRVCLRRSGTGRAPQAP